MACRCDPKKPETAVHVYLNIFTQNQLWGKTQWLPCRCHKFGIEYKGVLSYGILRLVIGSQVGEGLTRSAISLLLSSLFPVKGASKYRPHDSQPPVARTRKHLWLRPGRKILSARTGYCSNTDCANRFQCEDNNVD